MLCCVLEQILYPLLSSGSSEETSLNDQIIVNWEVKHHYKRNLSTGKLYGISRYIANSVNPDMLQCKML